MFCTLFGELGTRFVSRAFATAHRSVPPRNMYSCSVPCSGNWGHALFHERLPLLIGACSRGTRTHVPHPFRGTWDTLCFTSVPESQSIASLFRFRNKFGMTSSKLFFHIVILKPHSTNKAKLRTQNGMQLPPGHGRCAPRAPAHACSNKAELRTRNGMQLPPRARKVRPTRTGARLLQPSRT